MTSHSDPRGIVQTPRSGIADEDLGLYLTPAGVDYVMRFRRGDVPAPVPYHDGELSAAIRDAYEICRKAGGQGEDRELRESAKRVLLDTALAHGMCEAIDGTEPSGKDDRDLASSVAVMWQRTVLHLARLGDMDLRLAPVIAGQTTPRQSMFGRPLYGAGKPGLLAACPLLIEDQWIAAIAAHYQTSEPFTHREMRLAHRQFIDHVSKVPGSAAAGTITQLRTWQLERLRRAATADQADGRSIEWAKSVPGAWNVVECLEDFYTWVKTPKWFEAVADLCASGADISLKNERGESFLIWGMEEDPKLELAARLIEAVPGIHRVTPEFDAVHERLRQQNLEGGDLDAANACVAAIARAASQAPADQAVPARKAVRPVIL